jgi:hypothetical protein
MLKKGGPGFDAGGLEDLVGMLPDIGVMVTRVGQWG